MSKSRPVPVPIAFRSNPARYSFAGNARLINAYAEKNGEDAKAPMSVLPCPGLLQFAAVTDTPNRGLIACEDLNSIYGAFSSGVFKVNQDGTSSRIGTLPGNDQVQMSRNQASPVQVSIHCTAGEFYIEADVVKKVADTDVTSETIVSQENASGYTIYATSKGKYVYSALNNCASVDGLDFATAEQSADGLKRVISNGPDVFFFGTQTIEPWRVTGAVDLPFELIGGATQQKGIVAPLGVIKSNGSLSFASEDNGFYRMQGYVPQKISEHAQDRLLEADAAREAVQGQAYAFQGHQISNWTGSTYTTAYDAVTGLWHDRQSYGLSRWRARNAVRIWGKTIVGDELSGNLYSLDRATYQEGSDPLIWGVDTPFIHAFPNGGIVDALYLDMATGVGRTTSAEQGFDPVVMVSWTVDGGKSFMGHRQLKLGKRGDRVRIVTRRLGRFGPLGIQFRLRVSDPVIRSVIEMSADIRPLKR